MNQRFWDDRFADFWNNPQFSDVKICVEGRTIHGHRVILNDIPYFATLFANTGFTENRAWVVNLEAITYSSVEMMTKYAYAKTDVASFRRLPLQDRLRAYHETQRFLFAPFSNELRETLHNDRKDSSLYALERFAILETLAALDEPFELCPRDFNPYCIRRYSYDLLCRILRTITPEGAVRLRTPKLSSSRVKVCGLILAWVALHSPKTATTPEMTDMTPTTPDAITPDAITPDATTPVATPEQVQALISCILLGPNLQCYVHNCIASYRECPLLAPYINAILEKTANCQVPGCPHNDTAVRCPPSYNEL